MGIPLPAGAQVLLDGLSQWMRRKGFDTVDQLRGLLAASPGIDHTGTERDDYVSAMWQANTQSYGPW